MSADPQPHPAPFSPDVLEAFAAATPRGARVLDPLAGIGRIHVLAGRETWGVELEREWARAHPRTLVADSRALPFPDGTFDAIATSPPYGNRLADNPLRFKKQSRRRTYAGSLGRDLSPGSAASLQWGPKYRGLMAGIWAESVRVLRPEGRFVLNVKDHIRAKSIAGTTGWHLQELIGLGLRLVYVVSAGSGQGWRVGANSEARAGSELVALFVKP